MSESIDDAIARVKTHPSRISMSVTNFSVNTGPLVEQVIEGVLPKFRNVPGTVLEFKGGPRQLTLSAQVLKDDRPQIEGKRFTLYTRRELKNGRDHITYQILIIEGSYAGPYEFEPKL